MHEKVRMSIVTELSRNFDSDLLSIINRVLIKHLANYDIVNRTTEIELYQGDIPIEIKQFLVCKSIKGLTESSLKHYKLVLENFVLDINKDVKLLNTNDIRLFLLNYERTHNVGKSSLDDKRRILNSFFNWMVKEDYITKNPMARIESIKAEKKLREALTHLELEQVRNVANTLREKALLEILYSTGCRVSEIIALNKKDIDFQNGKVKVFGKGKKERYCFLNAKSQVAIKKYIFYRTDSEEALFISGKQPYNRLGKGTIEKELKILGERAKINKNVFPHLIRHTTATHMLGNGASLADVQMLLGHDSPQTTQIYAKLDIQNLQRIHQRCII